jgi:Flp pilus assembly protein TadG
MRIKPSGNQRRGSAIVETALVAVVLFMVVFGIFEYCRLLYVLQVTRNAARDTARFAAVHTSGGTMPGDASSFSQTDLVNLVNTGKIGSVKYGTGLCGSDTNIVAKNVTIFTVDPAGLNQTPPVIQPLSGSQWNTAAFGQFIAVKVEGKYRPVLPSLLFMQSEMDFTVVVMVNSEAN